jgi:hypothetical protein
MVEAARTIYTDANGLIRTLSLDQPFALMRFIAPPRIDEPDDTIKLEDLRWFAELVVDAGRVSAELIIQDVVVTFGHFGNRFERGGDDAGMDLVQTYALDRDRFRRFFGESTSEMLRLIADFTTEIPVVLDAQRQIREWLAENENANPE